MDFKSALAWDAAHVFLNENEFGDHKTVDGLSIPVLWREENALASDVLERGMDAWGVNCESAVLFIHESSMQAPVPEQELDVDGTIWTVKKVQFQTGLIRIELQRNTS